MSGMEGRERIGVNCVTGGGGGGLGVGLAGFNNGSNTGR